MKTDRQHPPMLSSVFLLLLLILLNPVFLPQTVDATAAYLTVRKEGERFGFAGEVFSSARTTIRLCGRSIADDVYRYRERRNPAILGTFGFEFQFGRDFVKDPLDYRNSWATRGYVRARSARPLRVLRQGEVRWVAQR